MSASSAHRGARRRSERREREHDRGEHPPPARHGRQELGVGRDREPGPRLLHLRDDREPARAEPRPQAREHREHRGLVAAVVAVLVHDEHVRDAGAAHAGGRSARASATNPTPASVRRNGRCTTRNGAASAGAHRRARGRPGLPVPAARRRADHVRRVRRVGARRRRARWVPRQAPRRECVLEPVEHVTGAGAVRLDRHDVVPGPPEPVRRGRPARTGGGGRRARRTRRTAPDGPGRSGAAHHRAGSATAASAAARRRPRRARAPRTRTRGRPRVRRCRRATPRRARRAPRRSAPSRWRVRSRPAPPRCTHPTRAASQAPMAPSPHPSSSTDRGATVADRPPDRVEAQPGHHRQRRQPTRRSA